MDDDHGRGHVRMNVALVWERACRSELLEKVPPGFKVAEPKLPPSAVTVCGIPAVSTLVHRTVSPTLFVTGLGMKLDP
jgi:hypothetical protein